MQIVRTLLISGRKVRTSERGVTEWTLRLCLQTRAVHALLSNQNEWQDTAGHYWADHTQSYNCAHYNFVLFCKWWITWRPSILIYIQGVSKKSETGLLLNSSGNRTAKNMLTYFLLKMHTKTFLADFRKSRYILQILKTKTTSNGRQPQNIKSWKSQQPPVRSYTNLKL